MTSKSPASAPVWDFAASRALAAAGMHQHQRLAQLPGPRGHLQELGRLAQHLDEYRKCIHVGRVDQRRQEILRSQHGLVTRRDGKRNAEPPAMERLAQVAIHRAALGHDADARPALGRNRPHRLERQRRSVREVDETEAIGAQHGDAMVPGDCGELVLCGLPGFAQLGEAGGKDDSAAHPAPPAGGDGFTHRSLRHDQYRRIDAFRQFVDGFKAADTIDFVAAAADQVQLARIAEALQVGQQQAADRSRIWGSADDRDGLGPQQAVQGKRGHADFLIDQR